jgi:hypothetical protein
MLKLKTHSGFRDFFDSDMSKSKNTVVYFEWKTVMHNGLAHMTADNNIVRSIFYSYFFNKVWKNKQYI